MAHMINQPIAWNHVTHGDTEFWTYQHVSVVKNPSTLLFDVMSDGSVIRPGFATSGDALNYAHAHIQNPVGL
jgi:hypothetical protein